uniref:Uncharacterized protein n=1 Tax=Anopheles epiroticus TaxID=199890 RepID=A0A182PEG4_9DIPT
MDEDQEFRDMVWKKMQENGSLIEMKAHLRAVLDEMLVNSDDPPSTAEERDPEAPLDSQTLAYELMMEALQVMNLNYTRNYLKKESGEKGQPLKREQLAKHVGLDTARLPNEEPLLVALLNKMRHQSEPLAAAGDGGRDSVPDVPTEA